MIKDKGQFLAKAKSMIVQDIQRRTVLTRADLNRLISLSSQIDLNPCFLITLQALTETRRIDTLVVPNRGELPTYPSEALNNIWLINSNPPSSFSSDTQIFPIEGTQNVSTCPRCNGAGEISRACWSCNGSGSRVCSNCAGSGSIVREEYVGSVRTVVREVCPYCGGRKSEVCSMCDGTGRVIEICSMCAGVGSVIGFRAVICDFKPYKWERVVSRWNLPSKLLQSMKEESVLEAEISPQVLPQLSKFPKEVQEELKGLVGEMKGLVGSDTRLVRNLLTIKTIPAACVTFRILGVDGNAWLLGKDFERLYLPKVPLTFDSWAKLKDWFSFGLAAVSLLGFLVLCLGILLHSTFSGVSVLLLFIGGGLWLVSSLALLVRRPRACLFLFVFTVLLALSFLVLVLFLVSLVSPSKP
jgi:hypothetical protein